MESKASQIDLLGNRESYVNGLNHHDQDITTSNSVLPTYEATLEEKRQQFPNNTIQQDAYPETITVYQQKSAAHDSNLRNDLIGFGLGITTSVLIAVSNGCVQALQGAVPDFELAVFRSAFLFVPACLYFLYQKALPRVPRSLWSWMVLYCTLILGNNLANYMAVTYLPVGVVSATRRALMIIIITILSRIVLKESITIPKILSSVLCIIGVFMILQPDFVFGNIFEKNPQVTESGVRSRWNEKYSKDVIHKLIYWINPDTAFINSETLYRVGNSSDITTQQPNDDNGIGDEIIGYILIVITALATTGSQTVQKYRLQEQQPICLNFWNGLSGIIIPLIISATTEEMTFPTGYANILLLLGQSLGSGAATIMGVKATQMTSAVLVTIAITPQVAWLLIGQYTVLKDIKPGKGNWAEILGAVLVMVAAVSPTIWNVIDQKLNPSCPYGIHTKKQITTEI